MSESNVQQQTTQPPAAPLDYRKMIEEAYMLAKQSQMNILKITEIVNDVIDKWVTAKEDVIQIKKQLAAIYLLSEQSKALTPDNVSNMILEKETEATKKELEFAVEKGALKTLEAVADIKNIIAFSYEEGGFGYQSVLALSEEDQKAAIGKKAGDKLGVLKIESIYELVNMDVQTPKDNQAGELADGTKEESAVSTSN